MNKNALSVGGFSLITSAFIINEASLMAVGAGLCVMAISMFVQEVYEYEQYEEKPKESK